VKPRVLCVTVNHDHGNMLKRMIKSIYSLPDKNKFDFILVDNNQEKEIINWVEKHYSQIKLIKNNSPHGFAKNINNIFKKYGTEYEYFCILNPDLIFSPNIIDKQIECLDNENDIGLTAPKLLNIDGTIQFSCRNFPKLKDSIGRFLQLDKLNNKLFSNYLMKEFSHNRNVDVDWVTGAMMIFRSKALIEVGYFDDDSFFMYCEDIDICKKLWLNSWRVHYVSSAVAKHHLLRKGINVFSRHFYFQFKSTINYYKKYGFNIIN